MTKVIRLKFLFQTLNTLVAKKCENNQTRFTARLNLLTNCNIFQINSNLVNDGIACWDKRELKRPIN